MAESEQHARHYEAYKLSEAQKQIYEKMRNITKEEQAARYSDDFCGCMQGDVHACADAQRRLNNQVNAWKELYSAFPQAKCMAKPNPTSICRGYDWEEVWRLNHNFLS